MPKQGSKSGKSSKTARVLNLLTDPASIETPENSRAAESPSESTRFTDDRQTQAKIRGALEMELSEMTPPARPTRTRPSRAARAIPMESTPAPAAESAPAPAVEAPPVPAVESTPAPAVEAPTVPAVESTPAPATEAPTVPAVESTPTPATEAPTVPAVEAAPAPVVESVPDDSAADAAPEDELLEAVFPVPSREPSKMEAAVNNLRSAGEKAPDEFICFNVTQALVEDKADKYIKMFGMCSCSRCRIDVIALSLSNLPPKYVVAKPHELIPRLSMYEQKYNAAVVAQVISSCKKVMDRPHHQRKTD